MNLKVNAKLNAKYTSTKYTVMETITSRIWRDEQDIRLREEEREDKLHRPIKE